MALQQLMAGFARMTIQSSSKVCTRAHIIPTQAMLQGDLNKKLLHTSQSCSRHLDSHIVPKWMLPSSRNKRWVERKPLTEREYTIKPIPMPRTGGRGPNGRIWNFRRGGGHKRNFRMIDWVRGGPKVGKPDEEVVCKIRYDPNRTARIALVARDERMRYIIATENMKAGDIIRSTQEISKEAVRPREGDAFPVGSLAVGTIISCVERFPGAGSRVSRAAGTQAQLIRKMGDKCAVRMPSRREMIISSQCVCTVGRVGNANQNQRVIGKAGRNRWLGIRPHSGRWHRKTGRFGRKIKKIKEALVYDKPFPKVLPKKIVEDVAPVNFYRR